MSIEIVPIERRHITGFREVLDGVAREGRWLAFLEAPPLPRIRRFVLNGLRNGLTQFVAVDDGRVVGWCDINPKTHETLRHSGVLGMGVAASHRGLGVGSALLGATLAASAAKGLRRVELVVRADNAVAIRLYQRHGFELEGRLRRVELVVRADNAVAIRLYQRHGFELEGRLRDYLVVDGLEYDALQMARLQR